MRASAGSGPKPNLTLTIASAQARWLSRASVTGCPTQVRRLTSELEEANARCTPEKTESTDTGAAGAAPAPMSASRERMARERVAWESERSQLMAEVALLRQQAATVAEVTAEAAARDGSSHVSALKPCTTGGSGSVSFASMEGEAMVDDGDSGIGSGGAGEGAGAAGMMGEELESVRRENVRLAAENAKLRKQQQAAALRAQVETHKTQVRASRRRPRVHTQTHAEVRAWLCGVSSPNRSLSLTGVYPSVPPSRATTCFTRASTRRP
jgi:hypothetical protein